MKSFSWELIHVSYQRKRGRVETLLNNDIRSPVPRQGDTLFHSDINGPMVVSKVVWNMHSEGDGAQVYVSSDPFLCDLKEAFRDGWEEGWDAHRAKAQTLSDISVTYSNDDFESDWECSATRRKMEER